MMILTVQPWFYHVSNICKIVFKSFHYWPIWAVGMRGRLATNFKGSRSSLAERVFANPTLYVYQLVFHLVCWNGALFWYKCKWDSSDCCCSAAEQDCCWFSCGRAASLQAVGEVQSNSSALGSLFWQLREGPYFFMHSNILLHREYQGQLFPWPSRATVFQRSHLAVKTGVFCSVQSNLARKSLALSNCFFPYAFLLGYLFFSECRFIIYFTCPKEHSCLLPSLSAPSKPLPVNRSTDSQTTCWLGLVCQ